jgi:hypothetical protein
MLLLIDNHLEDLGTDKNEISPVGFHCYYLWISLADLKIREALPRVMTFLQ